MNFEELQQEMNTIIEDVKKAIDMPVDASGKLPAGTQLTLEDLEQLLQRTQGVIDKLNKQAVDLAEKNGLSRDEMAKYIENPKNFSPEEWKAIQAMKGQVDQFQKMLMRNVISGQGSAETPAQIEKHRKPGGGGLKRNWVPL